MVILMKNDKKKVKTKLRQQDIKKYSNTEIDHVILKIKEKELQYTVLCVSIIVFIVLVSGYVIFSAIQNTSSNNTLRNGNLLIDYKDTKYGFGDVVTMRYINPLSDDKGKKLNNYQIKVSNKTIKDIRVDSLINGHIKSCGCIQKENAAYQSLSRKKYNRCLYGAAR